MNTCILSVLLVILVTVGHANANVDTLRDTSPAFVSIDADFGLGLLGIAYDAGISYRDGSTLLGLRVLHTHEIEISTIGGYTVGKRPLETVWEVETYFGRTAFDRGLRATALAGLSVTSGTQRGNIIPGSPYEYRPLKSTVIGIPVQGQITYIPYDYFGITLMYFVNFNFRKTFRGFVFGAQAILH
jgi:hypothetical protein